MQPSERARLEARLTELTRRLAESHDGYAQFGPYTLKSAMERGRIRRELGEAREARK